MNLFPAIAFQPTNQNRRVCGPLCLMLTLALFFSAPRSCRADMLTFNVQFSDVSSLGSNYSLFAQLSDTSGNLGSTNLTFQNFSGQSGAIAPFMLSDENPGGNETSTAFSAGSTSSPSPFSFNIMANFTPNAGQPDQLSFFFGNNADSTLDTNTVFGINFNSSDPSQVQFFTNGNANPNVPAPSITIMATPEPETWAMMMLGLIALGIADWKRRQKDQPALTA